MRIGQQQAIFRKGMSCNEVDTELTRFTNLCCGDRDNLTFINEDRSIVRRVV